MLKRCASEFADVECMSISGGWKEPAESVCEDIEASGEKEGGAMLLHVLIEEERVPTDRYNGVVAKKSRVDLEIFFGVLRQEFVVRARL